MQNSNFITKRDRLLLQSASGITKCDSRYYKVRRKRYYVNVPLKLVDVFDFYIISVILSACSFKTAMQFFRRKKCCLSSNQVTRKKNFNKSLFSPTGLFID